MVRLSSWNHNITMVGHRALQGHRCHRAVDPIPRKKFMVPMWKYETMVSKEVLNDSRGIGYLETNH